jgi:diguanylate cyclase (GGDEF)-like protein
MSKAFALRPSEVDPYSHESTAAALERLTATLEAQARVIRQYESRFEHHRHIFETASAAARLGVWECDLPSETLQWSGGTYDLFDVPRGAPVTRTQTLKCYPPESLKLLQSVRSRAIAERRGFNLDAEILTPKGNRRWIRISAAIDCAGDRPLRIFGIKQDITDEKAELERIRYRAEFDDMTGLANRGQFQTRLAQMCGDETGEPAAGTLLLIDLDGFKQVNDSLGHTAGDECLMETARRLGAVCRDASLVARLGGDEFAVLLLPPHQTKAADLAAMIVSAMNRPIDIDGRLFKIGASIGVAVANGCRSPELFKRADTALYAAKAGGRNTFRIFSPAS